MPPAETKQNNAIERIETLILILTVVISLGLVPLMGMHVAAGAGVGGLVAFVNLWVLRTLVTNLLGRGEDGEDDAQLSGRRKAALLSLALGKYVVLYGGLFLLLTRTPLSRVGFLIGFSTLLIGIMADGLRKQPIGAVAREGEHAENI